MISIGIVEGVIEDAVVIGTKVVVAFVLDATINGVADGK